VPGMEGFMSCYEWVKKKKKKKFWK
jgi:hypothetical protein